MKKAGQTKAKAKVKKESGAMLTLLQVKSGICTPKDQKATLRGLGLARIGQRVVREDDPAIRGMVRKVRHLVQIVND